MKAVGVKSLKAKLSEYLRLVKSGETVLVTERDEVIAELRPAHRQDMGASNFEEELTLAVDRGEVTLRNDESSLWPKLQPLSAAIELSSREILNALRDDS